MMQDDLAAGCLAYIRGLDYVSFVEFEEWLSGHGAETEGRWTLEPVRNLILWAGLSEQARSIFHQTRPHLDLTPCSLLIYVADGKTLNFPIAVRPPGNGYKEPHWLPVTLRAKAGSCGSGPADGGEDTEHTGE